MQDVTWILASDEPQPFHIPYTAGSSWQRPSRRRELSLDSNDFGSGKPVMQKKSVTIEQCPQNSATKKKKTDHCK